MFSLSSAPAGTTKEQYEHLERDVKALLHGETDPIANMANFASLLYHTLSNVNWTGFYLLKGKELVLGPFQGKPACIRIPIGRGVCGTAAARRETVLVEDVDMFPGHIACDSASRSEIVVPLIVQNQLYGVFDLDSPYPARFTIEDQQGLEKLIDIWICETMP